MTGKEKQEVWIFGNSDYDEDNLPLRIINELEAHLPDFVFKLKDPNEEWKMPEKLIIIDTVKGIDRVRAFTSLNDFADSPRMTMHDFDLVTNLKWLDKLKKLPPFLIVGVPPNIGEKDAVNNVVKILCAESV